VETDEQALAAAAALCELGAHCAIITRGERGALVYPRNGQVEFVKSVAVEVVDTTAAGDAFAAAFAVEFSNGATPVEAARFACRAGAVATSRLGAQVAMPTQGEIREMG
jgi:ribokinase